MSAETEFPTQEQELLDIWHAEQNYWKDERNVLIELEYLFTQQLITSSCTTSSACTAAEFRDNNA